MLAPCLADGAVDAVGGNDEIGVLVGGKARVDLGFESHLDPERTGALLQQTQQRRTGAAAEAVAADAMNGVLETDLDIVPIREIGGDSVVTLAVVGREGIEGFIGENHAEPEGVVAAIALEHDEARVRPGFLHQNREIEAGRPAADDVNLHAHLRRVWSGARVHRDTATLAHLRYILSLK